jgi:hypothetical protein
MWYILTAILLVIAVYCGYKLTLAIDQRIDRQSQD